jgi:hypothetical protein
VSLSIPIDMGDSGNGMAHCTAGAILISNLIPSRETGARCKILHE